MRVWLSVPGCVLLDMLRNAAVRTVSRTQAPRAATIRSVCVYTLRKSWQEGTFSVRTWLASLPSSTSPRSYRFSRFQFFCHQDAGVIVSSQFLQRALEDRCQRSSPQQLHSRRVSTAPETRAAVDPAALHSPFSCALAWLRSSVAYVVCSRAELCR